MLCYLIPKEIPPTRSAKNVTTMPRMEGTHRHGKHSVTIGRDGKIVAKEGDWLSKYSAAMYEGDPSRVSEFGRLWRGRMISVTDANRIVADETIYHIPTYQVPASTGVPDEAVRRIELRDFARTLGTGPNKCQRLVGVIAKSAELVDGLPNPSRSMIDDLEKVLIGQSLTQRGMGSNWAGINRGATGFRKNLQGRFDVSAHAMAGIVIGHRHHRLVQGLAKWLEDEAQDEHLYEETILLGRMLNDQNFKGLAERVRKAIGGPDCEPLPIQP